MKFTRFHLLRLLYPTAEEKKIEEQLDSRGGVQNVKSLKRCVKYHTCIDFIVLVLISFLTLLSKNPNDIEFTHKHALNIYTIILAQIFFCFYYYVVFFFSLSETDIFPNFTHTYRNILYLLQLYLTHSSYFLGIIYCLIYALNKRDIDFSHSSGEFHKFMLSFSDFYNGIRFIAFFLKYFYCSLIMPLNLSFIILGFLEDSLNIKLNEILKTKIYDKKPDIDDYRSPIVNVQASNCTICLHDFNQNDEVCHLPCSIFHTFHVSCLKVWLNNTITCPICRYDMSTDERFFKDYPVFEWFYKYNVFSDHNTLYHSRMMRGEIAAENEEIERRHFLDSIRLANYRRRRLPSYNRSRGTNSRSNQQSANTHEFQNLSSPINEEDTELNSRTDSRESPPPLT